MYLSDSLLSIIGHYEQDAALFAKWGAECGSSKKDHGIVLCSIFSLVDVKMDWCFTKINDTQLDPHNAYKAMVNMHAI